jgi:hypothetical protein
MLNNIGRCDAIGPKAKHDADKCTKLGTHTQITHVSRKIHMMDATVKKKKQISTCPALLEGLKLAAYRHNCINETHVDSFLCGVKPC